MSEIAAPWTTRPVSGALRVLPDRGLVRLAKRGDRGALSAICRRYQDELYRYCEAILHHSEEAKDALQNTLISAIGALPGEQREIELKPWLYRIAHNEAISVLRRRRQEANLDTVIERSAAGGELERRAELRQLVADLQSLGERQRGAIVMRELSGLSFEEIGAAFGSSAGAARQTVYEARLALQEQKEGRAMDCELAREAISANDGRLLRGRKVRAHLRDCASCTDFRTAIDGRRHDLALLAPPLPALAAAGILQSVLGGAGSAATAGGSAVAAGAGVAGKAVGASLALKSAAAVAAVAVLGGGAAATGVIDNPFNGEGSKSGDGASPSAKSSQAGAGGQEHSSAAAGAGQTSGGGSQAGEAGRNDGQGGKHRGADKDNRPGARATTPAGGAPPPGHAGGAAGNSENAPGHTNTPGSSGSTPSQSNPSTGAAPPGQSGSAGNSGSSWSQSNPSTGAPAPGQSSTPPGPSGSSTGSSSAVPVPPASSGSSSSHAAPATDAATPGQVKPE